MLALIGSALILAASAAPVEEARALRLVVLDSKDRPIGDLKADELAVVENGVARVVKRLAPDKRQITLALIVDTSAVLHDAYRPYILPAVLRLVRGLPGGTRLTLWTSGSRPERLVEPTRDPDAVEAALRRVVPEGGNTLFDAIDQALADLAAAEGQRSILVIVTGTGVEFSSRDTPRALDDPRRVGATEVFAVMAEEPLAVTEEANPEEGRSPAERRADYDRTLLTLARQTGGRCERALSFMSVSPALDLIAAEIGAGYVLDYASVPDLKQRKLTLRVARSKVRVRYAPASQTD
jgi:VWFA-related protein